MRPVAQVVFGMIRVDAIWLALGASDLRCGMDTLLARVVREIEGGARIHTAYVFANRSATRLKVLVYDGAGLWLCSRRLRVASSGPMGTTLMHPCRSPQRNGSGSLQGRRGST